MEAGSQEEGQGPRYGHGSGNGNNSQAELASTNGQNQMEQLSDAVASVIPFYGIPPGDTGTTSTSIVAIPPAAAAPPVAPTEAANLTMPFPTNAPPGASFASWSGPSNPQFFPHAGGFPQSLLYPAMNFPLPALQAAIHSSLAFLQAPPGQGQVQPNHDSLQQLFLAPAGATTQQRVVGVAPGVASAALLDEVDSAVPKQESAAPATETNRPSAALLSAISIAIPIYLDYDEEILTRYQCLLRKQIELFEAGPDDVRGSAQGRNTPIQLGQVGIRCRHCSYLPKNARARGAVYYSKTIDGLYQVAQNMGKLHFLKPTCHKIPPDTVQKLTRLHEVKNRASGGKEYWSQCLRVLGVYEDKSGLRIKQTSDAAGATKRSDGD
jgi:hypothetical protein